MLQIREKLVEDERKKNLREAKQAEVKQQILRRLIACVGPCETSDDVDCLIHRLQRDKDCVLLEALKDQIRYQKTILGRKGSLCLSGSVEDLILALKEHLSDPAFLWSLSHSFSQKMKTLMVDTMNLTLFSHQKKRSCPGEDADDADDDDDDRALFSFCKQGQWVAVLYDDQFYIGQVIEVAHGQSAVVKCLEQTEGQKDYYRWPRSEDVAETSAHYVYRWDFEVTPVSNDGRVWEVANIDDIASGYELINGVKTHRKLLFLVLDGLVSNIVQQISLF